MTDIKKKYLLLYLKTGGGHLAPAKSIAVQLQKLDSTVEPILIDGFKKAPQLVKFIIEDGYRRLQYKAQWFYEFLYAITKVKLVANTDSYIISSAVKDYIKEVIEEHKPEKILIFHFFLIKPVMFLLEEMKSDIKAFTIVTDPFTAHPLWFLNKKQNFIVFSTRLKNHCIAMGIKEWRIKVFPFILDEKFSHPVNPGNINEIKQKYSISSDKGVILMLGGGDGIPKGKKILTLLLKSHADKEIIVVCGNNKNLYNKVMKIKKRGEYHQLKVFGYVDFVYDLINTSDIVITKCGASTFMEIVMSRKIPVVTTYIWEQEKGNKEYIVQNGMGVYVKDLKTLPEMITRVFKNISFYRSNIEKAQLRNGAGDVAAYILNDREDINL
jgi:1,2-diacylglycerol 3-beta-galactosyltransferase